MYRSYLHLSFFQHRHLLPSSLSLTSLLFFLPSPHLVVRPCLESEDFVQMRCLMEGPHHTQGCAIPCASCYAYASGVCVCVRVYACVYVRVCVYVITCGVPAVARLPVLQIVIILTFKLSFSSCAHECCVCVCVREKECARV